MTAQASPLISFVLPVNGVEEYLPACLDSVLGQSGADAVIEVVAVDDASPDGCGRILDQRAAADPRLRVLHRTESAGPGAARNLGLAQARGEYVWFMDPDDLLADGSLAAVCEILAAERPDVLLLDYLILHPTGRTDPSPGMSLREAAAVRPAGAPPALADPAGAPQGVATAAALTLAKAPALINRTMTVWSKVLRRAFLTGLGVSFPAGIHEDVPVSCAALLAAQRIAALDRVCYLYRQRRRSFLATTSMGNFAIFDSYQRVFQWLDASGPGNGGPVADGVVRAAVFGRAMEHYSTVLAHRRVPLRARREFFRRMASDFRRYRPAGYRRPAGPRGLKAALVERDAYLAYELLAPLNDARVGLRRALSRARGRSAR